jgi:hypothetical protein
MMGRSSVEVRHGRAPGKIVAAYRVVKGANFDLAFTSVVGTASVAVEDSISHMLAESFFNSRRFRFVVIPNRKPLIFGKRQRKAPISLEERLMKWRDERRTSDSGRSAATEPGGSGTVDRDDLVRNL